MELITNQNTSEEMELSGDTRYNGNYILNLTGGKEFYWDKAKKNKVLVSMPISHIAVDSEKHQLMKKLQRWVEKPFSSKKKLSVFNNQLIFELI